MTGAHPSMLPRMGQESPSPRNIFAAECLIWGQKVSHEIRPYRIRYDQLRSVMRGLSELLGNSTEQQHWEMRPKFCCKFEWQSAVEKE